MIAGKTKAEAHQYALRCMAHRLRKFGFEPIVNRLDSPSKLLLSGMVHEPLASALRREAAQ